MRVDLGRDADELAFALEQRDPRAKVAWGRHAVSLRRHRHRPFLRELDGLVPRHCLPVVEGDRGSWLAEPGVGRSEGALAPSLREWWRVIYAELLPFGSDGAFEVKGVLVSSEAGGREGETQDLNGLLHHVANCERRFEGAEPVLLGEGVVPQVHRAVGEIVVGRNHAPDVLAVARRGMELECQRFCAFELTGTDEQLADAGGRAVDESGVTETAAELEVLLEELKRPRVLSALVQSPTQPFARYGELCFVPDDQPELDRLLVSPQPIGLVDVDLCEGGQRPRDERTVLLGG